MGLLVIERTRAGETRQGHLRWFDEAIAQFLDWNLNYHFFRGFYGAQAVGASASHDISHMHRTDVIQPCHKELALSRFTSLSEENILNE